VISLTDFEKVANARFEDAVTLAMYDRYDVAIYLCGFAVEIALKIRITKERKLTSFPETNAEFNSFPITKIKNHDLVKLRDLLQNSPLTISEHKWRFDLLSKHWDVSYRYRKLSGVNNRLLCFELIEAVEHLLKVIL